MRVDLPELVGKTILHKWQDGDQEYWYRGEVIKALGDINSECCEFEVQYLNEDGTVIVELYKDLKAGDIVIL